MAKGSGFRGLAVALVACLAVLAGCHGSDHDQHSSSGRPSSTAPAAMVAFGGKASNIPLTDGQVDRGDWWVRHREVGITGPAVQAAERFDVLYEWLIGHRGTTTHYDIGPVSRAVSTASATKTLQLADYGPGSLLRPSGSTRWVDTAQATRSGAQIEVRICVVYWPPGGAPSKSGLRSALQHSNVYTANLDVVQQGADWLVSAVRDATKGAIPQCQAWLSGLYRQAGLRQ